DVAPSGDVTTPESGVEPGETVVVPAAELLIVNVSDAVGSPPSTVSAIAGPAVSFTVMVSSPRPARTTSASVSAVGIETALRALTATVALVSRVTVMRSDDDVP